MPLDIDQVKALRAQFPALSRQVNGRPAVFLDGPAGTQVPERVIDAISAYLARHTVIRPKYVTRAKKAIKKAFTYQLENRCFSLVEVVSTCPTNWKMTPRESIEWTETTLLKYFKLGEYKTPESSEEA